MQQPKYIITGKTVVCQRSGYLAAKTEGERKPHTHKGSVPRSQVAQSPQKAKLELGPENLESTYSGPQAEGPTQSKSELRPRSP